MRTCLCMGESMSVSGRWLDIAQMDSLQSFARCWHVEGELGELQLVGLGTRGVKTRIPRQKLQRMMQLT